MLPASTLVPPPQRELAAAASAWADLRRQEFECRLDALTAGAARGRDACKPIADDRQQAFSRVLKEMHGG
jgi:hypothetical protein